jgi:hypothetical protein
MKDKFAGQIKKLKPGTSFIVKTEAERTVAIRTAGIMRKYGMIDFEVATRLVGDEFIVFAGKA